MFWWPVEVVVFIQMISLLLCFWPSAFFDPVTALESVISLRFCALLGFAKVCPLSGAFGFWNCGILVLLDKKNNICHGYPMCFAQAEVGNTARKKNKTCFLYFYWFLIGEPCWFWLILLILMSCMGCEQKHYRYKMFIAETNVCPEPLTYGRIL